MADECDGNWTSRITFFVKDGNPVPNPMSEPDGTITIDPHGSPAFTGRHVKGGDPIELDRTDCSNGALGNRRIRFRSRKEPSSNERIVYEGHVIGDRFIFGYFEHRDGPNEGDTGTWGATKEVGPFENKDKEGKGDRKS